MEAAAEAFLLEDDISSLQELYNKLDRTCLPKDVTEVQRNDEALFFGLQMHPRSGPKVDYCLVINAALELTLYSQGVKLPIERVAHISGI